MAHAGALTQSALLECDPADHGVRTPLEVYNTPVFVRDTVDTNNKVLIWTEQDLNNLPSGTTEGYYFVRYDWGGNPLLLPTCDIQTEDDFGPLPSPTDASERDGAVSTPTVVVGGTTREVYFPTLMGWVNSYEFGSDGWPDNSGTHYSSEVTHRDADAGTDTSGFVDPTQQVMIFGTRCSAKGDSDCEVNAGVTEWGRVFLTDLSNPTGAAPLDTLDLQAWTFGAPVGLSDAAGDEGDKLLVALGTYESVDADPASSGFEFNPTYDCSVHTLSVDGSGGAWNLVVEDTYPDPTGTDPDGTSCVPPDDGAGGFYHGAVDGFGGEPVPYDSTHLLASRYYGKLYSLSYSTTTMNLDKDWAVLLETATGHELRQPAEHSPVFAIYPDTATTKGVALWGANQYLLSESNGVITGATFVRIQVPGGVAIQSHGVYVATSDGRFWMYGTLQSETAPSSPNAFHLAGPTLGWPRFRKNLLGSARAY